jgi:hypothetical protein
LIVHANSTHPTSPAHHDIKCSFCGKLRSEDASMIVGPGRAAICGECLRTSADIVECPDAKAHDVERPSIVDWYAAAALQGLAGQWSRELDEDRIDSLATLCLRIGRACEKKRGR